MTAANRPDPRRRRFDDALLEAATEARVRVWSAAASLIGTDEVLRIVDELAAARDEPSCHTARKDIT